MTLTLNCKEERKGAVKRHGRCKVQEGESNNNKLGECARDGDDKMWLKREGDEERDGMDDGDSELHERTGAVMVMTKT